MIQKLEELLNLKYNKAGKLVRSPCLDGVDYIVKGYYPITITQEELSKFKTLEAAIEHLPVTLKEKEREVKSIAKQIQDGEWLPVKMLSKDGRVASGPHAIVTFKTYRQIEEETAPNAYYVDWRGYQGIQITPEKGVLYIFPAVSTLISDSSMCLVHEEDLETILRSKHNE